MDGTQASHLIGGSANPAAAQGAPGSQPQTFSPGSGLDLSRLLPTCPGQSPAGRDLPGPATPIGSHLAAITLNWRKKPCNSDSCIINSMDWAEMAP